MIMPNAPKPFMSVSPPSRERCLRIAALKYYFGPRAGQPERLVLPSDGAVRLPQVGDGTAQLMIWIGVPSGRSFSSLLTSPGCIRRQPFEICLPSTLGSCQPCTPTMPPYGQLARVGEKAERARITGSYGGPGASWMAQTE